MNLLLLAMFKTNQTIGTKTMNGMYQRDHKEAFENAKLKGLDKPNEYMYMYSKDGLDYFKNINFRNYINFKQQELMTQIIIFIALLIISIGGFVLGLIINDPLLITLSWISSVSAFILVMIDAFTDFFNPNF